MWIVCITSVRHVLTVNGYGGRQTKENEKSWCFKGWETLAINMNEQMDFVIPASKISSLQAGTLVGQVALDFGQEDNFPTAMYHCKTNLDLKKIKKEEEAYKELPKVYNFGTADNREKLLQKNFKRIYDEVETVIEQYV